MRDLSERYFPVVEQFLSSGLSATSFSKKYGIKIHTLIYWKKRYNDQDKDQQKGFAALSITEMEAKQISIEYTDGTRLTFSNSVDTLLLKSLIPVFNP